MARVKIWQFKIILLTLHTIIKIGKRHLRI